MNKVKTMKNKISITTKLLILVLGLQFVTIAILTHFNESNQRTDYIKQVDTKLEIIGHAANEFVLQEHHDKILDKNSIKDDEYIEMMMQLSSFANKANVQYVYSFIKRKDKVLVTSTSVTNDDFISDNYEKFFESYDFVTENLENSFINKKIFYEETNDKYGHVKTIIMPFLNQYGETYLVGVDIEIKELEIAIAEGRKNIFIISSIIFALSALIYLFLSSLLIKRIPKIRDGLEEFFDYLNSKRTDVSPIYIGGNDELSDMADIINKNIDLIGSNIQKDNELINEIASISRGVKQGDFSQTIEKEGNNPALNEVKTIVNAVLRDMQHVMVDILRVLEEFTKKDYNSKLDKYKLDGEMGQLVEQLNVFGKTISTDMLSTAYDSLNLEKDSTFTNDYMYKLTKKFNSYLSDIIKLEEIIEHLYRFDTKSVHKFEETLKEKDYAVDTLQKLRDELKILLRTSNDEKEKLKVYELLDDAIHSLTILSKTINDIDQVNNQSVETFELLQTNVKKLEEDIVTGNNSIDKMQKVSNNLNKLSEKMRNNIENSEFNGKDNIKTLMNYSDR